LQLSAPKTVIYYTTILIDTEQTVIERCVILDASFAS